MEENLSSYPLTRRPYAVAKDAPLLELVVRKSRLIVNPTDHELDEVLASVTKVQRSRIIVDVQSISSELEAHLEMLNRPALLLFQCSTQTIKIL